MSSDSTSQIELRGLRELSGRIGRDPLLVQGSTGNTSIKIDNCLWIKASGKWLKDAEDDDFLVSVDLTATTQNCREGAEIPKTLADCGGTSSIETPMHAVLPYKVVVHVHSVNAIAWAIRQDGPEKLAERLRDLNWRWIPYTPSGISLAKSIQRALASQPQTNVFILENHGLVVCEQSCRSVEQLLAAVESRLTIVPRRAPRPNADMLTRTSSEEDWSLPACRQVHALATDRLSRQILSGGVLYPCQVMFLPETVSKFQQHRPASVLLIEGSGVVCSKQATPAQLETLRGLAEVLQRVDQTAPIRYLTDSEISQVLNGPSYRGTVAGGYHFKTLTAASA